MKKSNKIIALCLSFVLLFAAVGGTIAWLTDKDKAENVFSVGSVDITLTEINKINDTFVPTMMDGKNHFNNVMPGDKITKTPVITNVGKNDAYVRVVVEVKNDGEQTAFTKGNYVKHNLINTMDQAIDSVFEQKIGKNTTEYNTFYNNIFDGWGISYLKSEATGGIIRFAMNQRTDAKVKHIDSVRAMADGSSWQFDKTNAFQSANEKNCVNLGYGGIAYSEYGKGYYGDLYGTTDGKLIYVFYLELKPEESYTLFNGFNVPEEFDTQSLAFFNGLEVNIYADAIQTQGFEATETEDAWVVAINALNEQHSLADLVAGN